ncbi:MAG: peptide-methionine (S)-S-oxide reductase [Candidatus Puniceispirillum sp.]|nr:peptide-methionine (S)-S-oxide reductase [Candidatus Puniceispirillum sp.]
MTASFLSKALRVAFCAALLWSGAAKTQGDATMPTSNKTLVVAMGCFWCAESEFRDPQTHRPKKGILDLKVGYAADPERAQGTETPTYEDHPGYVEALKITYDETQISRETLLNTFWHNVDPYDAQGQFCDKGPPYVAVLFYMNEEEKRDAQASLEKAKRDLEASGNNAPTQAITTRLLPFKSFFDAEDYHQDYKTKNPIRYNYYRWACGRDKRLGQIWGKS